MGADQPIPASAWSSDGRPGTHEGVPSSTRPSGWGMAVTRFGAAVLALAVAVLTSNNWGLVGIPAAVAAFCLDWAVCAVGLRALSEPMRAASRLVVGAVVGWAVGLALFVSPAWAFHEALGVDPPPGVHDVCVWRHYIGGPGEHVLIIAFAADDKILDELKRLWPTDRESRRVEAWKAAGRTWPQAWERFGPLCDPVGLAERSWRQIRPFANPEVTDFGPVHERGGDIALLQEPGTGRAVVLHVRF
jgi:hypothetical protein